jgi:sec-independent protein translocase protein TatA
MPHVSLPALIIILVIVVLLFGSGRVAKLGAELGVAVREFKKGLDSGDDKPDADKPKSELPPTTPTV